MKFFFKEEWSKILFVNEICHLYNGMSRTTIRNNRIIILRDILRYPFKLL